VRHVSHGAYLDRLNGERRRRQAGCILRNGGAIGHPKQTDAIQSDAVFQDFL
jgi:cytochrome b561